MELSDSKIGDVIVTMFSKEQDGLLGHAYIRIGDNLFFHVARIVVGDKWIPMDSNYSYTWKQISMVSGRIDKSTYAKVSNKKMKFAVIKVFDSKRVQ